MDPIAVTKPNMAVTRQEALSPFGLLTELFTEELARRSSLSTGFYRPMSLAYLEESQREALPAPPEIHLDLNVDLILNRLLKEAREKEKNEKKPQTPAERILERVVVREREIRTSHTETRRIVIETGERRFTASVPISNPAAPSGSAAQSSKDGGVPVRNEIRRGEDSLSTGKAVARGFEPSVKPFSALGIARPIFAGLSAQKKNLERVLPLASQMLSVPAAGGWTPKERELHPGYPVRKETKQDSGISAGSILLPDVLRRRREEAIARSETQRNAPGMQEEYVALGEALEWSTEGAEKTPETERVMREVRRAVEETLRRNAYREAEAYQRTAEHARSAEGSEQSIFYRQNRENREPSGRSHTDSEHEEAPEKTREVSHTDAAEKRAKRTDAAIDFGTSATRGHMTEKAADAFEQPKEVRDTALLQTARSANANLPGFSVEKRGHISVVPNETESEQSASAELIFRDGIDEAEPFQVPTEKMTTAAPTKATAGETAKPYGPQGTTHTVPNTHYKIAELIKTESSPAIPAETNAQAEKPELIFHEGAEEDAPSQAQAKTVIKTSLEKTMGEGPAENYGQTHVRDTIPTTRHDTAFDEPKIAAPVSAERNDFPETAELILRESWGETNLQTQNPHDIARKDVERSSEKKTDQLFLNEIPYFGNEDGRQSEDRAIPALPPKAPAETAFSGSVSSAETVYGVAVPKTTKETEHRDEPRIETIVHALSPVVPHEEAEAQAPAETVFLMKEDKAERQSADRPSLTAKPEKTTFPDISAKRYTEQPTASGKAYQDDIASGAGQAIEPAETQASPETSVPAAIPTRDAFEPLASSELSYRKSPGEAVPDNAIRTEIRTQTLKNGNLPTDISKNTTAPQAEIDRVLLETASPHSSAQPINASQQEAAIPSGSILTETPAETAMPASIPAEEYSEPQAQAEMVYIEKTDITEPKSTVIYEKTTLPHTRESFSADKASVSAGSTAEAEREPLTEASQPRAEHDVFLTESRSSLPQDKVRVETPSQTETAVPSAVPAEEYAESHTPTETVYLENEEKTSTQAVTHYEKSAQPQTPESVQKDITSIPYEPETEAEREIKGTLPQRAEYADIPTHPSELSTQLAADTEMRKEQVRELQTALPAEEYAERHTPTETVYIEKSVGAVPQSAIHADNQAQPRGSERGTSESSNFAFIPKADHGSADNILTRGTEHDSAITLSEASHPAAAHPEVPIDQSKIRTEDVAQSETALPAAIPAEEYEGQQAPTETVYLEKNEETSPRRIIQNGNVSPRGAVQYEKAAPQTAINSETRTQSGEQTNDNTRIIHKPTEPREVIHQDKEKTALPYGAANAEALAHPEAALSRKTENEDTYSQSEAPIPSAIPAEEALEMHLADELIYRDDAESDLHRGSIHTEKPIQPQASANIPGITLQKSSVSTAETAGEHEETPRVDSGANADEQQDTMPLSAFPTAEYNEASMPAELTYRDNTVEAPRTEEAQKKQAGQPLAGKAPVWKTEQKAPTVHSVKDNISSVQNAGHGRLPKLGWQHTASSAQNAAQGVPAQTKYKPTDGGVSTEAGSGRSEPLIQTESSIPSAIPAEEAPDASLPAELAYREIMIEALSQGSSENAVRTVRGETKTRTTEIPVYVRAESRRADPQAREDILHPTATGKTARDIRVSAEHGIKPFSASHPMKRGTAGTESKEAPVREPIMAALPVTEDTVASVPPELVFAAQTVMTEPPADPTAQRPVKPSDSDNTDNLPTWAKELLEKSGVSDTTKHSAVFSGRNAVPNANQINWSAPVAVSPRQNAQNGPAELAFKERAEDEQRSMYQQQISDAELRRTADRVYKLISEKIRLELRRSGR